MFKRIIGLTVAFIFIACAAAIPFGAEGCGAGECSDCHSLSIEQASQAIAKLSPQIKVSEVMLSQVPGLWDIIVERPDGVKLPVFLDFSLNYVIQGEAIKIDSRENITKDQLVRLNRVDYASVPVEDAVVLGDPEAKHKIIVFDDPECPYCKKLHVSMKEVVKERPDIAFYIKMLPLEIHPNAYDIAKAVICEKSLELFEMGLRGEEVPPPTCETDQIEKNRELAKSLRIGSTPTLILPDGRAYPGSKTPEQIYKLIDEVTAEKAEKE